MASPNSTFTELVSTTFRKHKREIADNVSNRNAFLKYIMMKGNKVTEDGGLSIVTPLEYQSNNTYQRYSDWDQLNISASDVISAAEYSWKQIAINVVASGRDLRINSGESRLINLVKSRVKNALHTFNNNFSGDLYSDGTLTNQVGGLQSIVSDLGTGTVGGIVSATYPFWLSQLYSAATLSVTPSATTIEGSLMLPAWLGLDRGPDDQPELIVADNTYYQYFEASQVSLKRYNDTTKGGAGFTSLKYKNADVIYDGNSGIPANHMYFLNMNYINLVVHKDADFETLDPMQSINQDGEVIRTIWMGNVTCSNRSRQGVVKA